MKTIDSPISNRIPVRGPLLEPERFLPLLLQGQAAFGGPLSPNASPADAAPALREVLFLDIETTGFSAKRASIYLIGCAFHTEEGWRIRQFFARTPAEEREVLEAFLSFAAAFSLFVHFNGQTFDIPFLAARCRRHSLPAFAPAAQCDIYRQISPWKNLLRLSGCRQKQLEAFLGIRREDPFHGGELIELYRAYGETQDAKLERVLLLHNAEDLSGLTALWHLLAYPAFLEGGCFTVEEVRPEEEGSRMLFALSLPCPLPAPLSCHSRGEEPVFFLAARENRALLRLPVLAGELKYFYPDYKNYSYLPEEDQAIHKSVAVYVDKSRRMPATADTCYTKKQGRFLPLPSPDTLPGLPRFRSARSAPAWLLADAAFLSSPERLYAYARDALAMAAPPCGGTQKKGNAN